MVTPRRHTLFYFLICFLFVQQAAVAQCSILQTLVKSFFPATISESDIRSFGEMTAPSLEQMLSLNEQKNLAQYPALSWPEGEARLRAALARFYAVGAGQYGVSIEPEVRVINTLDLNAFAAGHVVNLNLGLLLYFLNPREYWRRLGYPRVSADTNWANDWDSVYAVVAHEASHNLMRHQEEKIAEAGRHDVG